MTKRFFHLFFALVAVFSTSSCGEDEVSLSRTEVLALQPWIVSSANFKADGTSLNIYQKGAGSNLFDASKYEFTFLADGSLNAKDGAGAVVNGTWTLNAAGNKITLSAGLPFTELTVNSVSKANLDFTVPNYTFSAFGQTFKGDLLLLFEPKK
jgi:hypothetical protein